MPRKLTHASSMTPAYTGRLAMAPVPSLRMPDEAMDPTPRTASSTTS